MAKTKRRKAARKTKRKAKKRTVKRKVTRKKAVKRKTKRKASKRGKKSGLTSMTYGTSAALAAVVGNGRMTRPEITKKIWVYIKKHDLQDPKKRRMIRPDMKMKAIIGNKPIDMLKLATHLNKHIK